MKTGLTTIHLDYNLQKWPSETDMLNRTTISKWKWLDKQKNTHIILYLNCQVINNILLWSLLTRKFNLYPTHIFTSKYFLSWAVNVNGFQFLSTQKTFKHKMLWINSRTPYDITHLYLKYQRKPVQFLSHFLYWKSLNPENVLKDVLYKLKLKPRDIEIIQSH